MATNGPEQRAVRGRREPPRFRAVSVRRVERVTPRLIRITFEGNELDGLTVEQPAASVRLLLPMPGDDDLVVPTWNGNEFLLADGRRPTIRTFTPFRVDADAHELDVEIVVHGSGAASDWATAAAPGDHAAISGPGRGYTVDDNAPAYVVAGDETAIPAITQLLDAIPPETQVQAHVEIAHPDAELPLPDHRHATVSWHLLPAGAPPGDVLVDAARSADIAPETRVWAAGEAAAVQRIRRYLFEERAIPRRQTAVRGYWKHGRRGDADDDG